MGGPISRPQCAPKRGSRDALEVDLFAALLFAT
jgi:hypothetical protein